MGKPFSIDRTWLQCIGCNGKRDLLDERAFRCPDCGNLFEVAHDFSSAWTGISSLRRTFENRQRGVSYLRPAWEQSGIWRYKELIMPFLPAEYIVTLGEGVVPIIPAGKHLREWLGADIDLWFILEGMAPTGSFKDFGMTVMMSVARAAGIKAVVCASTGDTSASASAYATACGIQCVVVLPRGLVTAAQLVQPLVHGATVITLPGDFDACMKVVEELVRDYGAYPANSLNPVRIEGHQATVFQIAQFFDWNLPHWIAVPVGNGSNCSSVAKGLRTLKVTQLVCNLHWDVETRILGCQSEAANPLSRAWSKSITRWRSNYRPVKAGTTTATAARIGDPVSREKVMRGVAGSLGAMVTASERDLNDAVAVCGRDGIFVCPQTGIALAGVRDAAAKGLIRKGERVVAVSTATGLKFTESAARQLERNIIDATNCKTGTVAKLMGL